LITFLDEDRVRNLFKRWLEPDEETISIGKAYSKNWGTRYYTCSTDQRVLLVSWSHSNNEFVSKEVPIGNTDAYLKKKRIVLIPFDQPFLFEDKELVVYERLRDIILSNLPDGEELISMARARRNFLSYLLAISNNSLVVLRIKRKRREVLNAQAYKISELKELSLLYGKKRVVMEVPYENNFNLILKVEKADSKAELYSIMTVYGWGGTAA
jgi:hypothetical protein